MSCCWKLVTGQLDVEIIGTRVLARKLGKHPILAKKVQFLEKKVGLKYFTISYSMPLLSILHQNKALHTFHKKGQYQIARHIKSLE